MSRADQFRKGEFPEKDWKKAERYIEKLSSGEKVLLLGKFSGVKTMVLCLFIILAVVLINRTFLGNTFVMLACNVGAVVAAFEASKALAIAQNSVAVVTDRRIIGVIETKTFDLRYKDIKSIGASNFLFLDTGDPKTSIRIKHMTNAHEFYQAVRQQHQKNH